ncbi:hypothetical protein L4D06_23025 [Enterovibrio makurazakiensis]|uniref:DUF2946 domain-containing protein n=1 Tax=Enterovibrio gelatinilyticus TaxID=2899819 RepID=A0ABT5R2A8_9GAMM|nr:hypothetical protein [Enterovibrio sp. ZSDZ42]MDD1794407.1 hypothetical protein [Enterovibrio sp. ZSDZ42]
MTLTAYLAHNKSFKRAMLCASTLSWLLVSLMPVINAHGSSAGVWATLCTVNGFELVQVEEGETSKTHSSKPCPFSHFSSFHHHSLSFNPVYTRSSEIALESYPYFVKRIRFELPVTRAPPSFLLA